MLKFTYDMRSLCIGIINIPTHSTYNQLRIYIHYSTFSDGIFLQSDDRQMNDWSNNNKRDIDYTYIGLLDSSYSSA